MTHCRICVTGAALLLAGPSIACQQSKSEVEAACRGGYLNLFCDAISDEERAGALVDDCLAHHEAAKTHGKECEEAHIALLNCLDTLYCEDLVPWIDDKCGANAAELCGAEAASFCMLCPGVWYAPG